METKQLELSNRLFYVSAALIGVVIIALIIGAAVSVKSLSGNEPRYITITGEGTAYAIPDIATVSFGITKEGSDIPTLTSKTNSEMNEMIQAIKDAGVDAKDIKTIQYSLNPKYDYQRDTGARTLSGYEMTQSVTVKIRDFNKIGAVYTAASNANVIGSIYFSVDNDEQVKQQAREEAINKAKEKAKNIASISGLRLGKLVDVSEGYNYYSAYEKAVGMGGSDGSAPAPTIEPGQQEVNITVTLTYKVK